MNYNLKIIWIRCLNIFKKEFKKYKRRKKVKKNVVFKKVMEIGIFSMEMLSIKVIKCLNSLHKHAVKPQKYLNLEEHREIAINLQ